MYPRLFSSDHERHREESQSVRSLSCCQSSGAASDVSRRLGEVSEEFERLPGLQEERLPEILLYLRWWAAFYSWQSRSTVCARAHDQGKLKQTIQWAMQWLRPCVIILGRFLRPLKNNRVEITIQRRCLGQRRLKNNFIFYYFRMSWYSKVNEFVFLGTEYESEYGIGCGLGTPRRTWSLHVVVLGGR